MDSKKIRILLRAVEQGSMMRIAEQEGYTPSGLTHMMTAIERELDIKLLERSSQGVQLSLAGKKLYPLLQQYVKVEDRILAEISHMKAENDSVIRIAAYPSLAKNWIPGIMRDYRRIHPEISFELRTMIRPQAYSELELGKADVIFAGDEKGANFRFHLLQEDEYLAAFPVSHVADLPADELPIKMLEQYPFIMPSYNADTEVQQMLARHNVSPKSLAVVADYQTIMNMISNGLGLSVLSTLILRDAPAGIGTLPLSPRASRKLGIATRPTRELSATKRQFLEFVLQRFA